MATAPPFKPCDALTAADVEAHSLWGFDTAFEHDVEDADETWVRPYEYDAVPEDSDVLFAAAQVRAGAHPRHRRAFDLAEGASIWEAIVRISEPASYDPMSAPGRKLDRGIKAVSELLQLARAVFEPVFAGGGRP